MTAKKKATSVKRAQPNKGTIAVDFPEGATAYCVECEATVEIAGAKKVQVSGKAAIGGTCPKCGEKVFAFQKAKAKTTKKAPVKPKATEDIELPKGLTDKAAKAYERIAKAGKLETQWIGRLKSGKSVWWAGGYKRWRIVHDPIASEEERELLSLLGAIRDEL